jgi:hypothetical protein
MNGASRKKLTKLTKSSFSNQEFLSLSILTLQTENSLLSREETKNLVSSVQVEIFLSGVKKQDLLSIPEPASQINGKMRDFMSPTLSIHALAKKSLIFLFNKITFHSSQYQNIASIK